MPRKRQPQTSGVPTNMTTGTLEDGTPVAIIVDMNRTDVDHGAIAGEDDPLVGRRVERVSGTVWRLV